jgi:glycosyltransferase involved in cell wall biosynthesis
MKVLAIVPYHLNYCAGQRFRIELWEKRLAQRGFTIEYLPFTNSDLTDVLYQPKLQGKKAFHLIKCFIGQLVRTLKVNKPDVIYLYREAALIGPAIIEKIIKRWDVPIIYDIDEPIFVPYISPSNGTLNKLKFFSKYDGIFKISDSVWAVNQAIAKYADKFNKNVHIVPMAVDTQRYKPAVSKKENKKPIIAWVGTRTNQPNIELAVPALQKLRKEIDFTFRIIADEPMAFDGLDVEFIPWSFDKEVPLLQESDIGVVPVKESEWSPWKFFFKTVQFLGLGMPVVATATGSNLDIIENGKNGFLVNTEDDWYDKIKILLQNAGLRKEFGENGRKTVLERFDIERQFEFLENQFNEVKEKHSLKKGNGVVKSF